MPAGPRVTAPSPASRRRSRCSTADATGQGQAAALTAIGGGRPERDADVPRSRRPFRVDVLPSRMSFADAWEMRDTDAARSPAVGPGRRRRRRDHGLRPGPGRRPAGVRHRGPGKSGRSTVLMSLARSYLRQGARVVVAAPRPSPLRELGAPKGCWASSPGASIDEDDYRRLDAASAEHPVVVLVDDAELLRGLDAEDVLQRHHRARHGPALGTRHRRRRRGRLLRLLAAGRSTPRRPAAARCSHRSTRRAAS